MTKVVRGDLRSGATHHTLSTPGVSGEIPFFSGASTLNHTSDFVWDDINSRLGIRGTPAEALDVHGNAIIGPDTAGAFASIELGLNSSGNRFAYFDMINDDTYTDYGFRAIRANAGANSSMQLLNRGTGVFYISAEDAGSVALRTANTNRILVAPDGKVGFGDDTPTEVVDVNSNAVRVRDDQTPASAGATGNKGTICWDADYVYVCVAADTWKRATLATW